MGVKIDLEEKFPRTTAIQEKEKRCQRYTEDLELGILQSEPRIGQHKDNVDKIHERFEAEGLMRRQSKESAEEK